MKMRNETHVEAGYLGACRKLIAQLKKVRETIAASYRGLVGSNQHLLELALNEAEALAWQSEFPQLFFPTLAEEKVQALGAWHERQKSLRNNSRFATAA